MQEVEKNLKISPWDEKLTSRGLIFGGFFNPWDEEIYTRHPAHSEIPYLTEKIPIWDLTTALQVEAPIINFLTNLIEFLRIRI